LKVRRISFKERESRLKAAAHMVGLTGLLNRKPAQLSGGQRQRVALARSIVSRRRVCLMDEPLSNLDAKLRAEMREEIRALQQRLGLTMVYVTHDQVEAMTMADQVVLLKNGRIVQMGTPHQLYEHPKTTFAAQFLGSPPMNLLKIEKIENSSAVEELCGGAALAERLPGAAIGVRPEDVRVDGFGLPVRICAVDYLGSESVLRMIHGEQTLFAKTDGGQRYQPGERLYVRWAPTAVHRFNADGVRIEA
jgi:sn-glycerol 3-phosphate transport system ATP-binding protein